jgi:adenylate cyclase
MDRRLAAILAADVVGYSRLMGQDETGTLQALKAVRTEVVDPKIAEHAGRVFKSTGDGVLAEFPSVVNAVACAIAIQRAMSAHNTDLPIDRAMQLRIGVNTGDVIVEGEDIFGDGINVAARLESIAPPGGVVVSSTALDHLGNRLDVRFEDIGEQTLKNIERPVRAYQVLLGTPAAPVVSSNGRPTKPSVAVLPFANMSDDTEQQYFSDGITEDIITELSRFRSLFVIARNSSFQYRDKTTDVRRVARELGVQYVVEGSIRRAGERLRITAQLIDAKTGDHVWAERYDREMQDIFAVQDEMARTIAATLEGRVAASAAANVKRKPTRDWKAYDYFLQGRNRDAQYDFANAESFYARAVELDPTYGHAHAFRAIELAVMNWAHQEPELLRRAQACAELALSLDTHDAWSHLAVGYVAMQQGKFDLAGVHLERAVALNPNDVLIAADHAEYLVRTGRLDEALQRLDAAMKRDPFPASWIWEVRFFALFHLKRYNEAVAALSNMANLHDWHHAFFAAAYAHANRMDDAHAAVVRYLEATSNASIALVAASEPYSDRRLLEHLIDGMRKAGLPE